jgi:hypothetical protein
VFHQGSKMGAEAFYQLFLFIQIGNYLWNLVFLLGSQMGDEILYEIDSFYLDRELPVEPGIPHG